MKYGNTQKGGYQIIDLSSVTVGTQATISGIYANVGGNNGKPVMIDTPDGQRVFAEIKAGTNKYVTAYLGADGATYTVEISNANKVDITKQPSDATTSAKVTALETRVGVDVIDSAVTELVSYDSSSNAYTLPSDGLIRIICAATASNKIALCTINKQGSINELSVLFGTTSGQLSCSTYLKKGMKVFFTVTGTGNQVNFYPFTNS